MELLTVRDSLKPFGPYRSLRRKEGGPSLFLVADQSGNFADASPRRYRSVVTGSLSAIASPWGPAIHFPGAGNAFAVVQSNEFVSMPSRSWGITFRTTDNTKWLGFYNGSSQECGLQIQSTGKLFWTYFPASVTSTIAVNDGNWHTVFGTANLVGGKVTLALYLDGNIIAGPTTTTAGSQGGAEDDWLAIGCTTGSAHGFSGSLAGDIERFVVFPRALTQAEVLVETLDANWRLRRPALPRGSLFGYVFSVLMDTPCWLDSLGAPHRDSFLGLDSPSGVRGDSTLPLDSLVSARADSLVPLDSAGSIAVRMDAAMPLESLAAQQADAAPAVDSAGTTIYADFGAAIVAALENDAACAAAFGHTTATPKFQASLAFQPQTPYVRILEIPADDTFESADGAGVIHYFERGQVQIDVFASSQQLARSLGKLVAAALNDAPLAFEDGTNLEFRQQRPFFVPEPDAGPGVAVIYHRVILFLYVNQYTL